MLAIITVLSYNVSTLIMTLHDIVREMMSCGLSFYAILI